MAALALGLAACADDGLLQPDDPAQRAFVSQAYGPATHAAVNTGVHTWQVAGQTVNVVFSEPEGQATLPLVIYLPGLGETSAAGERWRTAWSAAGYAVLGIQALTADAEAWNSDLALNGEFKALGRRHFSGVAMASRLRLLDAVVGEVQRRSAAGEREWQRLDWGRVVVAGFDLGAYTALTLAGERLPDADLPVPEHRLKIRAVIALSPYVATSVAASATASASTSASPSAAALDVRYGGIRVPVLSVTGDADGDLLGLVADASLRRVPFDHIQGPGQVLLSLQGVHHANLSGDTAAPRKKDGGTAAATGTDTQTGSDDSAQRSRGGGGKRKGAADTPRPSRSRGGNSGIDDSDQMLPPKALRLRRVAAESISTAFLDAEVKGDARARDWLSATAPAWLGAYGELQQK